jgi:hypothetical protein
MDSFLESDYEDRNGGTVDLDEYDDEDEYDNYDDEDEPYDSPSIEDTIGEWPSYAN